MIYVANKSIADGFFSHLGGVFFRWVLTRHPAARRAAIKCHDVGKNDEMVVNMHVRKIFWWGSLEECHFSLLFLEIILNMIECNLVSYSYNSFY
jgi:hypothetical protein